MGRNVSRESLIDAGFDTAAIKHRNCKFRPTNVEKTLYFNRGIDAEKLFGFDIPLLELRFDKGID